MVLSDGMAIRRRDWDQDYSTGDTPWDAGAPSPALLEVIAKGELPTGVNVMVPGCGYGHDVRALAEAGCKVTGLDISETAIAGARMANGTVGADYRIADLFDPGLVSEKHYDVIWEHTCFCAIMPSERDAYVDATYNLLKPGGVLLGVFFAFADEPDLEGPPFKTNIENIHRHFDQRFELEWQRRPEQSYASREGEELLMCWRK